MLFKLESVDIYCRMTYQKLESKTTPGATYGKTLGLSPTREVPYDGRHLSVFYADYGVEPKDMWGYIKRSRVGSIFTLPIGFPLIVPVD